MVKFANECMTILSKLRLTLSETLGEDTKQLTARLGIHSGPVTVSARSVTIFDF